MEHTFPYVWQDKRILWHNGEGYRIASGDRDNSYLTLWTEDNKLVGRLTTSVIKKRHPTRHILETRFKINLITIEKPHRRKGLGLQLFRTLLAWMPDTISGTYSHLPDRSNHTQIPRIYRKLNGYILDEDHAFIDRPTVSGAA